MAVDVGYLSAVGAGAISFLSPCVLPLVPPYLCYIASVTVEDFSLGQRRRGAVMCALVVGWKIILRMLHFVESGGRETRFERTCTT